MSRKIKIKPIQYGFQINVDDNPEMIYLYQKGQKSEVFDTSHLFASAPITTITNKAVKAKGENPYTLQELMQWEREIGNCFNKLNYSADESEKKALSKIIDLASASRSKEDWNLWYERTVDDFDFLKQQGHDIQNKCPELRML